MVVQLLLNGFQTFLNIGCQHRIVNFGDLIVKLFFKPGNCLLYCCIHQGFNFVAFTSLQVSAGCLLQKQQGKYCKQDLHGNFHYRAVLRIQISSLNYEIKCERWLLVIVLSNRHTACTFPDSHRE